MKRLSLFVAGIALAGLAACHKTTDNNAVNVTEDQVLQDFVNTTVLPQYQAFSTAGHNLFAAAGVLNTQVNQANLDSMRAVWRRTRSLWEQCEGFLIGPVEDDNYDPNMDTWPIDYLQIDSFLATNGPNYGLPSGQALRGFHPLEYLLWGKNGNNPYDSITDNKKREYMMNLTITLMRTADSLYDSWRADHGNFQNIFLTAGIGSTRFPKKQDAFLAIVAGLSDICDEVGNGKIKEPFDSRDSTKTESPFSHNSMQDFKDNIVGAQNVYLCSYNGQSGASLSQFVYARNIALDNKIKSQFTAAITALGLVTGNFETAIYTQRTQLQAAMDALNALQSTLDNDLKTFVVNYVKD